MKERRTYSLYLLVLSEIYPQKNAAGMDKKRAPAVIIPRSNKVPPIAGVITYSGMNTDNRPNAISWKKNPNRHIATRLLQSWIKTFGRPKNDSCQKLVENVS